jgi:fumarylpyruvate hydrolase
MSVARYVVPAIEETVVPVHGGGLFPVRRIYGVGRNYVEHIREMKEADERDPPFFFMPAGVGAVVPGDDIEVAIDGLAPLRISIDPPED